ncbi:MAG: type 1 glutamine amidotransferase [Phycisphaeraceae bacterium]
MATIIFEHHSQETPARLGAILRDYGHHLRVVELHAGDSVPVDLDDVDAVVSMGGPMNVADRDEHPWLAKEMELIREAHERDLPVVGICLGAQIVAAALGGEVAPMDEPELGWHTVKLAFPGTIDPMLAGIPWTTMQVHGHARQITELPPGATPLAASRATRTQAFKAGLHTYAFQYHFEWTRADIETAAASFGAWFGADNKPAEATRRGIEKHYELYRHLGDRLCHNIANLLMPLDKRLGGRRGAVEPVPVKNWKPAKS